MTPFGNVLIFQAYTSENEYELFKSDGHQVELIKDIALEKCDDFSYHCGSNPEYFTIINGKVLFAASSGVSYPNDKELWITDGTSEGTKMVADICVGDCSSQPRYLYRSGNQVFFSADDGQSGVELWAYIPSLQYIFLPNLSR